MDLQQFLEELKDIDFTALDREQQEERKNHELGLHRHHRRRHTRRANCTRPHPDPSVPPRQQRTH